MACGTATALLTGSAAGRVEPGPELADVPAGDGMLGVGDGVSVTLKETIKETYV